MTHEDANDATATAPIQESEAAEAEPADGAPAEAQADGPDVTCPRCGAANIPGGSQCEACGFDLSALQSEDGSTGLTEAQKDQDPPPPPEAPTEAPPELPPPTHIDHTQTSTDVSQRPFLVDGVALTEGQIVRLQNLMAGTARPGPGTPIELPQAINLWRGQNHVVTTSIGRRRWQVHSNSPTWRESEASEESDQGPPSSGPLNFQATIREALVSPTSPRGHLWDIVLIREGWSNNGRYYPRRVLQEAVDAGLFNGGKICDYGVDAMGLHDHLDLKAQAQVPGGVPARNIIGFVDGVYGEIIDGRYTVLGRFHCTDAHQQTLLSESWESGHRDFLGFSIDAVGDCARGTAEGRTGWIVESIQHVFETTLVSKPAAGGRLERLVASNNRRPKPMKTGARMRKFLADRMPSQRAAVNNLAGRRLAESFAFAVRKAIREGDPNDEAQSLLIDVVQELLGDPNNVQIAKMILAKVQANIQMEGGVGDDGAGDDGGDALSLDEADGDGDSDGDGTEVRCANCGTMNDDGSDVCKGCGAPLDAGIDNFNESRQRETDAKRRAELEKQAKQGSKKITEAAVQMERIVESMRVKETQATLRLLLADAKLPAASHVKLAESFSGKAADEKTLREAIEKERAYLVEVGAPTGNVEQTGQARVQVVRESRDKLQAALDKMVGFRPNESRDQEHIRESKDRDLKPLLMPGKTYDDIKPFKKLREAYTAFTDDPICSFMYGDNSPYMQMIRNGQFREATEASFSYALGVAMTRRMIMDYLEQKALWRTVVSIDPNVENFKTQYRILWGGIGNLPVVAESDSGYSYPYLGFPFQAETSYYVVTRGGLIGITRKMIIDDDLGALLQMSKRLGEGAHLTLEKFVWSLLLGASSGNGLNGDTMWDSNAVYCNQHRNYQTGALTYNNLLALRQQMRDQYQYANPFVLAAGYTAGGTTLSVIADKGNPITSVSGIQVGDFLQVDSEVLSVTAVAAPSSGTVALTVVGAQLGTTAANHSSGVTGYQYGDSIDISNLNLVVPVNLEGTATQILNSQWVPGSANNDKNFFYDESNGGRIKPIVLPSQYFRGLQNSYLLVSDPKTIECAQIAFLNNRQEPEILVQDTPQVGYVFTGDNITYKIRHEYGGAMLDWKGVAGSINT